MDVQSIVPQISAATNSLRAGIVAGGVDDSTRSKIDIDVTAIEEALLELKTVRNVSAPLLCLPPEVLTEIAEHLAEIWPSQCSLNMANEFRTRSRLNWVRLSHVCNGLRTLLLGYPKLWARHICDIPIQPTKMLARCEGLPLTLSLRSTSPPFMVGFALEHMRHAWDIDIQGIYQGIDAELGPTTLPNKIHTRQFSQTTFPHLEKLRLELTRGGFEHQTTQDVLMLPPMVAPCLKSLLLVDCMIPFSPDTLTSLTLQSFVQDDDFRIPVEEMFDLLRRCVLLEQLRVMDCLPILPADRDPAEELVTLPRLEDMNIEDRADSSLGLWKSLRTPRLDQAQVTLFDTKSYYPIRSSHLAPLAPCLRSVGQGVVGLSLFDWSDTGIHDDAMTLVLHSADPSSICDRSGPPAQDHRKKLKLNLYEVDTSGPHLLNVLGTVSTDIDCSSVTTLELGSQHNYTSSAWSTPFARFSNVHTLFLQDMPRSHALLALLCPTATQGEHSPIIFPALRLLWLSELDLRGFDPDEELVDSGLDETRFEDILSSRAACGSPIEHLRIDTLFAIDLVYVREAFMPRLRELVSIVECEDLKE